MLYGHYQRTKPMMVVRRNWNPQESSRGGQKSLPIKSGVLPMSGQCIVPEWVSANSRFEWVLADRSVSAHRAEVPCFAQQDYDTADVRGSGLLTGLPCSSDYELQTGYYSTVGDVPLTSGTPLTYGQASDSNAGSVVPCARGGGPTVPVVGYLTVDHHAGPVSLVGEHSGATDLNVVRFNTKYDPQNAAS